MTLTLQEQFNERCMRPVMWCNKYGYSYEVWRQLSNGYLTARRGKAKEMRLELERQGFDFAYLDSEENKRKRREKYEYNIQRLG